MIVEESTKREYLGDSVYVEVAEGQLVLTTNNGEGPTNTIYMERFVFAQLIRFVARPDVRELF